MKEKVQEIIASLRLKNLDGTAAALQDILDNCETEHELFNLWSTARKLLEK